MKISGMEQTIIKRPKHIKNNDMFVIFKRTDLFTFTVQWIYIWHLINFENISLSYSFNYMFFSAYIVLWLFDNRYLDSSLGQIILRAKAYI